MLKSRRPCWLLVAVGLGLMLLPGCGRRYATVSGTAVLPKDVKLTETDLVQIAFLPDNKGEKVGSALFNTTDNTFVSKDIVPGCKYKIAVKIEPISAAGDMQKRVAEFVAFNKAFEPASTKLVFQASEDWAQTIAIDFVKVTVTKK